MNKTLEELFMEIFEDKNAEEKLKNASTIEEIYDCCRSKGYRKNIAAFEIELKNLIYEINQTLNIPEDFLEKVAGGITNSRFNKMTAGLLSLMSLGSVTASPIGAVPNLSNSAPIKNKLSINTALSKESLKKYGAILGAPAALIAGGGGLPLLLTLKNEIQSTKKASLKKTSQLIIDEAKDLDKFNSLKTEDIAGIFSTILDEVYGYINQEKPKDIIFPKSNRDLLAAILQQLHTITSKLDKESSQYKKLEKLKLAFIGLNHELFKNNQSAVSSQIAPPSAPSLPSFTPPPAPTPPPLPPTTNIAPSTSLKIKRTGQSSRLNNSASPIENAEATLADFYRKAKERKERNTEDNTSNSSNASTANSFDPKKMVEDAKKLQETRKREEEQVKTIMEKFPNLGDNNWRNEYISKSTRALETDVKNSSAIEEKSEKDKRAKEIHNKLFELEFIIRAHQEIQNIKRSDMKPMCAPFDRLTSEINTNLFLKISDRPKNIYKNVNWDMLVKKVKKINH